MPYKIRKMSVADHGPVVSLWRKVDGVGKDRDGAYTVRGQTWVSPHTKGKGNLVKKSRVVVDGDGKTPQDQG